MNLTFRMLVNRTFSKVKPLKFLESYLWNLDKNTSYFSRYPPINYGIHQLISTNQIWNTSADIYQSTYTVKDSFIFGDWTKSL